ncbi:hypothetical protein [Sunxiuqinia dokdonensis]|uniref:Uncharacterized protein n=1 Tax=Sunxiuqinia dokdonensis TaxID=1409788 RepID=A0A0L8V4I1_9BACT|nr:hypothetical protein [Sunxiuqinia dokdonensis]KOH43334.1 hypothetical protein NC99_38940 [Sunxiuqinia dokdonensis]
MQSNENCAGVWFGGFWVELGGGWEIWRIGKLQPYEDHRSENDLIIAENRETIFVDEIIKNQQRIE